MNKLLEHGKYLETVTILEHSACVDKLDIYAKMASS